MHARLLLGAVLVLVATPVSAPAADRSGSPEATAAGLKQKVRGLRHRLTVVEEQLKEFASLPGPPSGPAGGDLIGSFPKPFIGENAVGPLEIQNPNRSVNLPIAGFVNWQDNIPIAHQTAEPDPDTNLNSPDFTAEFNALDYAIEFDAGPGADDPDSDNIATTFTVPPDYASGGQFAVRVSKQPPISPVDERLRCTVVINSNPVATEIPGGAAGYGSRVTTTTENTSYTVAPPGTYHAGDTVQPICGVDDGTAGGKTFDDATYVHSVEFRYTSIQ